MSTDVSQGSLSTTPPADCTDTVLVPEGFDDLGHEGKLKALLENRAGTIRTEIDKLLGLGRTEYTGSQAHQFNKEELGLVLLALGGPER